MGFPPYKAEQRLQCMEVQKKEEQEMHKRKLLKRAHESGRLTSGL